MQNKQKQNAKMHRKNNEKILYMLVKEKTSP